MKEVIVTIVHLQSVRTEQTPVQDQAILVDVLKVSTQNQLALVLLSQRSVLHVLLSQMSVLHVLLSQRSVLHVSFSIVHDCDPYVDQATIVDALKVSTQCNSPYKEL